MNTMKWLVRREMWEHKGGVLWAPVITAAITLAMLAISMFLGDGPRLNTSQFGDLASNLGAAKQAMIVSGLAGNYMAIGLPIFIALAFMVFFFSLSALSDERKDRSVLFWKSMPVSDGETVASKALIALLLAPTIAVLVAIASSFVGLLMVLAFGSLNGLDLFSEVLSNDAVYLAPVQMLAAVPIYALWALPAVGWLMLVGAIAPRKAFLWALLIPVMAGVIVSWFSMTVGINDGWFWENVSGRVIFSVVPGSWLDASGFDHTTSLPSLSRLIAQQSWDLLGSARLWVGAFAGAGMLLVAAKVRRHAGDI